MGLIKAAIGAVGSAVGDSFKDYIYCESLDNSTLMKRGYPKSSGGAGAYSQNSVITDGSRIAVNDGQFLIVVEDGKIVDFSAEQGEYIFHTNTAPSLFCGQFGERLKNTFAIIGQRFAFGGIAPNDQRAYFVNTKEILNNKFGFGNIPFRDGEFNITVTLQGFGMYSYRIVDPLMFYANVCGNADVFTSANLDMQMKAELQNSLLPALGKLSDRNIRYDRIPSETPTLSQLLNLELSSAWEAARGINISTLVFSNIIPDEQSVLKIRQMQESRVYSENTAMLGARIGAAQANAMEAAAANPAGAAAGFVGVGMAGAVGGVDPNALLRNATQASGAQAPNVPQSTPKAVMQTNPPGNPVNPQNPKQWQCSCGLLNDAKICPKCGAMRPQMCLSCGYRFDEPKNADFCPKCGKEIKKSNSVRAGVSVPLSARPPQSVTPQTVTPKKAREWQCSCGLLNNAKICPKCGAMRPD